MKNEIRELIKKIVGDINEPFVIGKASNIEGRTCTVSPVDGGADLEKVRLNAYSDGDQGLIIKPKSGTFVIVGKISEVDAMVIMCYEIDSVEIVIGDTTFKMKGGETLFNGGSNGGFIKINDLVTKLNNIESKVNALVNYTATHTHSGVTTGSGVSGVSTTPVTGVLIQTQKSDIENTKIKH